MLGALLPVSGQVNDSLLVFQGKLEKVRREHVEIPDRMFPEFFDYYTLVTLTIRIDKVLSGDYHDDHIRLGYLSSEDDEDLAHYNNVLAVTDLATEVHHGYEIDGYALWDCFPIFKTTDGEWVVPFDYGPNVRIFNYNAEDAESVRIAWNTWMSRKGMPFVYKGHDWSKKLVRVFLTRSGSRLIYRSPKQKEYYRKVGNKVAPRYGIRLDRQIDRITQDYYEYMNYTDD